MNCWNRVGIFYIENGFRCSWRLCRFQSRTSGLYFKKGGTRWGSWLRHCAASRSVAGSIPVGVYGISRFGRAMALGLTQPLTEMSTRNISWGVKAARAYGWQPYHLYVLTVLKSGSLNLPEPSGPVQACNGTALPLLLPLLAILQQSCNRATFCEEFDYIFGRVRNWGAGIAQSV